MTTVKIKNNQTQLNVPLRRGICLRLHLPSNHHMAQSFRFLDLHF